MKKTFLSLALLIAFITSSIEVQAQQKVYANMLTYGWIRSTGSHWCDTLKSAHMRLTTNPSINYVLTCTDAGGEVGWAAVTGTSWGLLGNAGTTAATNFIGTTDAKSLAFRTNNVRRMIIDSLGNVGIGTTAPTSLLTQQSAVADESATLGIERLAAYTISTPADWTEAPAGTFTHVGNTTTITNAYTIVTAAKYQLSFTISGNTVGTVTVSYGGLSKVSTAGSNTTYTFGGTTTSTAGFVITPTATFNGAISAISLKIITGVSTPTYAIKDNTETNNFEIRSSLNTFYNTFVGKNSGAYNTTGYQNSAQGVNSLYSNTTGYQNSAQGVNSLYNNATGYQNSAQGVYSLYSNTAGYYNSAQGAYSLYNNTTGYQNSAQGVYSLYSNTIGYYNSAQGVNSLHNNTTGYQNSAQGVNSLHNNTTGYNNSGLGFSAGRYNTTQNNRLYINSIDRTNILGDSTLSIIYGLQAATTAAQKLYLNSNVLISNNVGIGTTTPKQQLSVTGSARITDSLYLQKSILQTSDTILTKSGHVVGYKIIESYSPNTVTVANTGTAIPITKSTVEITTDGDGDEDNGTLADGTIIGQIIRIYVVAMGNASDSFKITPATLLGGTKITFAGASGVLGNGCTLVWTASGWAIVGNYGGVKS